MNSGTRICGSTAIDIVGAKVSTDCSPIASEYLAPESRNARRMPIRQNTAPNSYYSLAITFPTGVYFDSAVNNVTVNYTCAIKSGGIDWVEQSATPQLITVTSSRNYLETVYSIYTYYLHILFYPLTCTDIPKYALYVTPECRYLRPITSSPLVTVEITLTTGSPQVTIYREETFNISTQILSFTPYLATATPTGGKII